MTDPVQQFKTCPNCGAPYVVARGMVPQTLGHEGYFACGYLDSDDGIAPPRTPPVCRYAARLRADRDYLDNVQAAYQTGIGLARLELSGADPDSELAMQRLNRAIEESDRIRSEHQEARHAG